MERVLAPVFVLIALCAGISLDFYSARRANPGLSPQDYVHLRLGSVMGPDDASTAARGDDAGAATANAAPGDVRTPSALGALALAAGAMAGLAGRGTQAADAPAAAIGTVDPAASPEQMHKQAAAAFAQVALALATGNRDAIFPAAAPASDPAATPAAPPAPPPSLIQPVKRLTSGSCAGTKFCSVGGN